MRMPEVYGTLRDRCASFSSRSSRASKPPVEHESVPGEAVQNTGCRCSTLVPCILHNNILTKSRPIQQFATPESFGGNYFLSHKSPVVQAQTVPSIWGTGCYMQLVTVNKCKFTEFTALSSRSLAQKLKPFRGDHWMQKRIYSETFQRAFIPNLAS